METITGYSSSIIFRNEENGYTVFTLVSEGEEITCVGNLDSLRTGETLALTGTYTEHVSYGRQFRVASYEVRIPTDAAAIERYLASGAVRGIGETLAHRIVKRFGDDTIRIMQEEPERLAEIKGISDRKAREIGAALETQKEMRDAMMFLQEYGISLALGIRIFKEYGQEMYSILKENPYRLAEDIDGIGFKTADEIAGKLGMRLDAPFRIRSAVLYVLMQGAQEGSVYLPYSLLMQRTAQLLSLTEEQIDHEINSIAIERKIILKRAGDEELRVYHAHYYYLELSCAKKLLDMNGITGEDEEEVEQRIALLAKTAKVSLDPAQMDAVRYAARYGITVITGGPGTGKTTTVREILRYFAGVERRRILMAAPTGRAARRLLETTGYPASTIHRLLEISSVNEEAQNAFRFARNKDNPLEADAVIIDEMSMVDISLMHALLDAVAPGTKLILVGDVDQLPSVGPGRVLRDIIEAGCFPTVRLNRIFRQAQESDIVVNAHLINEGKQPSFDNKSRDFFFLRRDDVRRTIANTAELILQKLPSYVEAKPMELQVLTPMRKGALGVEQLNKVLQSYLNPPDPKKREKEYGETLFREGDKVMQIRNNYSLSWEVRGKYGIPVDEGEGIFNGDIGVIRSIDSYSSTMTVEFDERREVEYGFELLGELELAYAVTIHKAQGSEYPAVILPILGGPQMLLSRNLLYTAVTRAKKCVVILGREDVVRSMIDNVREDGRFTSLSECVRELAAVRSER